MGAADANTDCVAQLQCGNQVTELTCGAGVDRLTGATLLVAGTCADCSAGTWGVVSGLTDCATYTAAGNQLTGESRAVGRTKNADQTSIAACAANTYAGSDTANCVAQTVCGAQTDTTARLTGASLTAAGTCEACDTGSWGGTAIAACTPCTTDANAATGATYTCTSATTSKISACKALYWKDTTGAAEVCKAVVACGKDAVAPATPADRTPTTAASATANTVCGACQAGYWAAAGDNTACAAKSACGDQMPVGAATAVARTSTNAASVVANSVCTPCADGTFDASGFGTCVDHTTTKVLNCGNTAATSTTCAATRATVAGDATTDASCAQCADGSFTTGGGTTDCDLNTVCGMQFGGSAGDRAAGDASRIVEGTCSACAAASYAVNDQTDCVLNPVCGEASAAVAGGCLAVQRAAGTAPTREVAGTCAACGAGFWAKLDTDACQADGAAPTCGKQKDGATGDRLVAASDTAAAYCADCAGATWAAGPTDDCAAHTTCGNQVAAECPSVVVSRLTGASLVAAGSCADCAAGTYAAGDTDTCLAHTTCGFQKDGTTTRLKDATKLAAGTCDACAANTWGSAAGVAAGDCAAQTVCGMQSGGAAGDRLTGASITAQGTCAACVDGFWAKLDTDDCKADGTAPTCGKQKDGATGDRLVAATNTAAAYCADQVAAGCPSAVAS